MKKLFICLPILFVVTVVFANKLFYSNTSKLVNKEISFAIYTDNNYNTTAYDSSLAQVEVIVKRINGKSSYTTLTKTYDAMQLKQYASANNAATEKINIPDVKDGKEYLEVTYTVEYNTKGSVLTFEKTEIIGKGVNHTNINVKI